MSPLTFIRSHADTFARCGSVVASYRSKNGRRCGPYYRLAYRSDGRQLSLYLGASEQLAAQVRSLLAELQARRDYFRQVARSERQRREHLLRLKRQWQQAALAHGLYARGWELRGWRPPSLPRLNLPRASLSIPHVPSVPYRFYTSILRPMAAPIVIEPPTPSTKETRSVSEATSSPTTTETRSESEDTTTETRNASENHPCSTSESRPLRPRIWQNRPPVDQIAHSSNLTAHFALHHKPTTAAVAARAQLY